MVEELSGKVTLHSTALILSDSAHTSLQLREFLLLSLDSWYSLSEGVSTSSKDFFRSLLSSSSVDLEISFSLDLDL